MPSQRRLIWTLGLGAFGLAFSLTITATCLPAILSKYTDSAGLIGVILGAEGFFALAVSPVIGPWSDSFHTPLGRRKPFMLAALGPIGFCLLMMPFMPNVWTVALIVLAFFFAYYVYEPPYRGLYPDLVPRSHLGRSQGVQHQLRGIALLLGSVGGILLLKVWDASPFIVASVVTTAACGAAIFLTREEGGHSRVFDGVRRYYAHSWRVFRDEPDLRRFLLANGAWEGAFAAARSFVYLYVTAGLAQSKTTASGVLGAVAGGYVVAALVAGRLGDRFGIARVIFVSSFIYGGGYLLAGLAQTWHDWFLVFIFLVSIAGGTVMTLAWGLLFKLTPAEHRGAFSGLATTTKGIGLLAGAPLAGLAIDLAKPHLKATDGYQVLWLFCGVLILAAIPLVASLIKREAALSGTVEIQPG